MVIYAERTRHWWEQALLVGYGLVVAAVTFAVFTLLRSDPPRIAALRPVVAKYPKHRRASYAQNLIGRAYLDEGKPSLAAVAFYNNYKDRPSGARAGAMPWRRALSACRSALNRLRSCGRP